MPVYAPHTIAPLGSIVGAITAVLGPMGFRKRSKRLWWRELEELTQVVHLEKWSKGSQNVIHVRMHPVLNGVRFAEWKMFGVIFNYPSVAPDKQQLEKLLNQENTGFSIEERAAGITESLAAHLAPDLDLMADKEGFHAARKKYPKHGDLVIWGGAARWLGVDQPPGVAPSQAH